MVTDAFSANMAITDFYATVRDGLDEVARNRLAAIISTPIMAQKVSEFSEFVYANADLFTTEQKAVVADVCRYATVNTFYGLGENQRGFKITTVLEGGTVEDAPAAQHDMMLSPPVAPLYITLPDTPTE